MLHRIVLAALIFIYSSACALAQPDTALSPELQQMIINAGNNMRVGNYKDALTTYRQLMILRKDNPIPYIGAGTAYYNLGQYDEAIAVLRKATEMPGTTADAYVTLSATYLAQGKSKEAINIARKGLASFPSAGQLYYQSGLSYWQTNDREAALRMWITGTEMAPGYAGNYKKAAACYLQSDDVLWGLLYGETAIAMRGDTTGNTELKVALYTGWKRFFEQLPDTHEQGTPFEKEVKNTFLQLSPVVSDGISTENITMIKTRFMLAWYDAGKVKYPFALFDMYDTLLRTGRFDVYNEWLHGYAESPKQYEAWNTFHKNKLADLLTGNSSLLTSLAPTPSYHDMSNTSLRKVISQKKKR